MNKLQSWCLVPGASDHSGHRSLWVIPPLLLDVTYYFLCSVVCSQTFPYTAGDKDGTMWAWNNLGRSCWCVNSVDSHKFGRDVLELVGRVLSRQWRARRLGPWRWICSFLTNVLDLCRQNSPSSGCVPAVTAASCVVRHSLARAGRPGDQWHGRGF